VEVADERNSSLELVVQSERTTSPVLLERDLTATAAEEVEQHSTPEMLESLMTRSSVVTAPAARLHRPASPVALPATGLDELRSVAGQMWL